MSENIWDMKKWAHLLPPETPASRKRQERTRREELERWRRQRDLQNYAMKLWGYKPWKREDRRNRPLRTKRSWVSFRARMREADIVKLHCGQGLTFRAIGKLLGISHVAAWKRYQSFEQSSRLQDAYRAKCLHAIQWKMNEMERLQTKLVHCSIEERHRVHVSLGLVPPK